jgi:PTH1 family peptidyl-tRNA hydrolase
VKPQTFMNNSGMAVRSILDYYKLIPRKFGLFTSKDSNLSDVLTIIHDDLDIDFPNYKLSINAGSAGHNGIESIMKHLKTKNFKRIRLGIKNEFKNNIPGEKFVLQNFSREELDGLDNIFQKIII